MKNRITKIKLALEKILEKRSKEEIDRPLLCTFFMLSFCLVIWGIAGIFKFWMQGLMLSGIFSLVAGIWFVIFFIRNFEVEHK